MDAVFAAVSAVAISALTSWFTVRFAIQRFRAEKLFERRLDAYSKVIESMHCVLRCLDRWIDMHERQVQASESVHAAIRIEYTQNTNELRRLIDMGELLFSSEASAVLFALRGELDSARTDYAMFGDFEPERTAVAAALSKFPALAKKDLDR